MKSFAVRALFHLFNFQQMRLTMNGEAEFEVEVVKLRIVGQTHVLKFFGVPLFSYGPGFVTELCVFVIAGRSSSGSVKLSAASVLPMAMALPQVLALPSHGCEGRIHTALPHTPSPR